MQNMRRVVFPWKMIVRRVVLARCEVVVKWDLVPLFSLIQVVKSTQEAGFRKLYFRASLTCKEIEELHRGGVWIRSVRTHSVGIVKRVTPSPRYEARAAIRNGSGRFESCAARPIRNIMSMSLSACHSGSARLR